ncbi:MAG: DUF779 domain-containing protein [Chromatiaceae bacterium]|nr:DUF779 domain-containing protein [Chromatiaceae bacterium]
MDTRRVIATDAARALIETLADKHGSLVFHQPDGCCGSSAPMCYPQSKLLVADNDYLLGEICGAPFYISAARFEYWRHTQLIIDVVEGRGEKSSLEEAAGQRFLLRSRLFTDKEWEKLKRRYLTSDDDAPNGELRL